MEATADNSNPVLVLNNAINKFHFDSENRIVIINDRIHKLSIAESLILQLLVENLNSPVSKEILNRTGNTPVSIKIARLRRKIELDYNLPTLIRTVHRSGYMLSLPGKIKRIID